MQLITDGLLVAGALFAGIYCWVLSRRVLALKNLDSGLGGAITQMTRALEDARRALEEAKTSNREGRQELRELINRADAASGQLRILLAAGRDLAPPAAASTETEPAESWPTEPVAERLPEPAPPKTRETEDGTADLAGGDTTPIPKPRRVFPVEALRPRQLAAPLDERDLLAELASLATGRR